MQIRVRLSAGLARLTGRPLVQMDLPEGATVAELLQHLREHYPALAPHVARAVPMVRGDHAGQDQALAHGEEVALLVPVAGG